jgi:prefoldin subunit 5
MRSENAPMTAQREQLKASGATATQLREYDRAMEQMDQAMRQIDKQMRALERKLDQLPE